MQPVLPTKPSLEEVFEASPSGLLVCQALRDAEGQIVDFQATYVNSAAARLLGIPQEAFLQGTMLHTQPGAQESGLFDRYVNLVETGEAFESEIFINNRWYSGSVVRLGDGFLVTFQGLDEAKAALRREEEARALLEGVLNATPLAINHLEAELDERGEPVDFVFRVVNPASERIGGQRASDLVGHRLTERYPSVRETGIFDQYVAVWKTGQPWQTELFYEGEGLSTWFSFLVTKHAGGLVTLINNIGDRKQAELDTQRQAELLQGVMNAAQGYIAYCEAVRDPGGRVTDFVYRQTNEAVDRFVGLPNGGAVGRRMTELFPGVKENGLLRRYAEAVETGRAETFEFPYDADGHQGWFLITASPLAEGFVLSFLDITDRKQAELRQAELAGQLRAILNNTPVGVALMRSVRNETGELVDLEWTLVNDSTTRTVLLPGENMTGKRLLELFPNVRTMGAWDGFYKKTVETRTPQLLETYYEGEGLKGWYRLEGTPYGDGMLLTLTEITGRKEAELEVQRQAALLEEIIQNTQAGIVLFEAVRDEAGTVVDFRYRISNAVNTLVTGVPRERMEGNRMLEMFPSTQPTGFFESMRTTLEGGTATRYEMYYRGDTVDNWLDISLAPMGDGVLFTFLDITPIKQAEEAQARQAELFNQVINTSLNGILLLQPVRDEAGRTRDFRVRLFNQAAHDLTGLPWEWSQTRTLLEMHASIGTSGLLTAAAEVLETGDPLRVEFYFEPVDRWFDMSVARLDAELVVTFSDISAVRESVLERQRHAATQQALLDGSINAILACEAVRDDTGAVVDFNMAAGNRAVEVMLARPLGEVVGQKLLAEYPGNVETGSFQRYKDTVETGRPQRFEMYYNHDGLDTWFDVSTVKSGDGLIISFLDVSEARRAQQALVGESILFQALSSHVPETGVLVCNTSKRVLFANGELPPLFHRVDQPRLPGKFLGDVLKPEHRTDVMAAFRGAIDGHPRQTAEQYGEAYYEVFYAPVENADGRVVMAMATFRNVTRDRLYQQQLKQSNENLERFAYVASHDLQEPLRKIQSFGDMLYRKQKDRLDEPGLDLIRRMQGSAERMNELIRDLLTYSRVSSTIPEFGDVALGNLLADVRNDLDLVVREKGASLRVDALPVVSGDALQLRQLFQNLLSNALKFSQPGTPPAVEVRHRLVPGAETEAMLLLQPDATYHEISISDNGIGFDEQYADRIFEAFQRLHGRGAYPGTGIGLAIVKKVVENHRGGLSVSSRLGEGSTFRVYLPVEEER